MELAFRKWLDKKAAYEYSVSGSTKFYKQVSFRKMHKI